MPAAASSCASALTAACSSSPAATVSPRSQRRRPILSSAPVAGPAPTAASASAPRTAAFPRAAAFLLLLDRSPLPPARGQRRPRAGPPRARLGASAAARLGVPRLPAREALEGERSQVAVRYADLKGSMEWLADRDPEDARHILDQVLEHMMEAVHRYEGTVNQVMGD